jgi:hypothetical protein
MPSKNLGVQDIPVRAVLVLARSFCCTNWSVCCVHVAVYGGPGDSSTFYLAFA